MGKDDRAAFTDYTTIHKNLCDILSNIDDTLKYSSSKFLYAEALARMYKLLLEIHPFREGNGRTVREFLRQYVLSRNKFLSDFNYELDFSIISNDKEKLDKAVKSEVLGELVMIFNELLTCEPKLDKNKNL